MGCGAPSSFATSLLSLGGMIDSGTQVRVLCTKRCGMRDLDLVALAERVGRAYSLVDRRCKCRLTPGCRGWNRFYYLLGVYRPLWRPETGDRWIWERSA